MFAIPSRTTHYISGSSLSGTFVWERSDYL
jgi:hypothetical protein